LSAEYIFIISPTSSSFMYISFA